MKAPGRGLVRVQSREPEQAEERASLKTKTAAQNSRAARPFLTRGGMPADKTGAQLQSVAATPASAANKAQAGAKINPQRASSAPSSLAPYKCRLQRAADAVEERSLRERARARPRLAGPVQDLV